LISSRRHFCAVLVGNTVWPHIKHNFKDIINSLLGMQRGGVVRAAWHHTIALNIQINAAVFRLSSAAAATPIQFDKN
jgi:hypothetical protein